MTATETATVTATETATITATETATVTATETATETATQSATVTATETATQTATETATSTASASPSDTPTQTPTFTASPTPNLPRFLSLYPNPVRNGGELSLYLGSAGAESNWRVYTLAGELVANLAFKGPSRHGWSTRNVASGIYIIQVEVRYPNGALEVLKLKGVVLR